jgi:predicted DNA-binding transcriptional regulator YafY
MRASRLLTIQMLLQTRGRMSATALAEALEVSVRTLYRDVDQLSAAGVPVVAERGRLGGFELLDGWKTTLTGLTPSESQAVFLSGLAGPADELGLGGAVQTAQLKLLAALPAPWRDDAQRVSQRMHLDPVDWYRDVEATPHLPQVAAAVWSEHQLSMHYDSWKARVQRTVSPLGLVLKAGVWYLVAAVDDGVRTFRVSNIRQLATLETRARRPRTFDLPTYWTASIQRFERALYSGQATVLATPLGLRGLRGLGAAAARAVAAAEAGTRSRGRSDGRRQLRLPIESVDQASGALLRLAPEVEVLAPAALRQAVIQRLRAAAHLYGDGDAAAALAAPAPGPVRRVSTSPATGAAPRPRPAAKSRRAHRPR